MPSKDSSVDVTQLRKRASKLEDVSVQSYQTGNEERKETEQKDI